MSVKTLKTIEISQALGLSRKGVLEKAQKEKWAFIKKGNAMLWVESKLPINVRFALAAQGDRICAKEDTFDSKKDAFAKASEKARQVAIWKSAVLFKYRESELNVENFVEAFNCGAVDKILLSKIGKVSKATLYNWLKAFKKQGAEGLIAKYGMNTGGAGASLTDLEKNYLRHFWLKNTQPTVSHALMLMKANIPYSNCSYQVANNYLKSIPLCIADFYRKGKSRFENAYLPYMEQDVERYKSLDLVVSDHHVLDCVCIDNGKLIRPWITTMQDYRSGKILGWCVCRKPSSLSIIVAYYMTCIVYGIPRELLFDNGKDYRSKLLNGKAESITVFLPEGIEQETEVYFEGIFNIIGSSVSFTRVCNGKSKGRQERYFRILGEYLAKDFGSYIGSDSRTRPEDAILMWRSINGMEKREDIKSFEEFQESANAMTQYINDNFICTGKGVDGMTRSEAFEKFLPPSDQIRHASKELLQSALAESEVRKCGRNGVKVHGLNFYHPDLFRFVGNEVIVKTSLIIDSEVQVYDSKGSFICTAYADFFKESGNLEIDINRLESSRKRSLKWLAEQGSDEVQASPEYNTMLEVASGVYSKTKLPDLDEELELPKAVGAENDFLKKSENHSSTGVKENKLLDPYTSDNSDWM
ncbi:MAG: Mu transposase C-terminal domain-containing protein [Treponemataceae bacterium]